MAVPVRRTTSASYATSSAAPAFAPVVKPKARRAPLTVVSEQESKRRRLVNRLVRVGVVAGVASMFIAVGLHAEVAEQQMEIDRTRDAVVAAQEYYNEQRLAIAALEAPDRIVNTAMAIGLVTPETVTYLHAEGSFGAEPTGERRDGSWPEVKQHLAARP